MGFKMGFKVGIKIGVKKGTALAQFDVVQKCLAMGMSVNAISDLLETSPKEVRRLAK